MATEGCLAVSYGGMCVICGAATQCCHCHWQRICCQQYSRCAAGCNSKSVPNIHTKAALRSQCPFGNAKTADKQEDHDSRTHNGHKFCAQSRCHHLPSAWHWGLSRPDCGGRRTKCDTTTADRTTRSQHNSRESGRSDADRCSAPVQCRTCKRRQHRPCMPNFAGGGHNHDATLWIYNVVNHRSALPMP